MNIVQDLYEPKMVKNYKIIFRDASSVAHGENIRKYIDELPHLKGSAIILDDNSERIYPMRVRPRFTWHGGEAPTAVKVEKRF